MNPLQMVKDERFISHLFVGYQCEDALCLLSYTNQFFNDGNFKKTHFPYITTNKSSHKHSFAATSDLEQIHAKLNKEFYIILN